MEDFFDLARGDILAAANDHVLDSTDDVDVAVIVHDRQVTAVHPAVRSIGRRSRRWVVPVAEHDTVAASAKLAGRATRTVVAGLRIDDLDFDVRERPADPADPPLERVVGASCVTIGDVSVMP